MSAVLGALGAGGITAALGRLVIQKGTVVVATSLALAWMRTAGYLANRFGQPFELFFPPGTPEATKRLFGGPGVFPVPFLPMPFLGSFLSGFAYKDAEDVADGWLSFFGSIIFAPVPGVETSIERAIKGAIRGDLVTFGEESAEALAEETGLRFLAAFFDGAAQIGRDFQALGLPVAHPAPWIFGGVIGGITWLDKAFRDVGGFLGGLLEGEVPPFEPELPTTTEGVRELARATRRVSKRVPDFLRIIAELKKG